MKFTNNEKTNDPAQVRDWLEQCLSLHATNLHATSDVTSDVASDVTKRTFNKDVQNPRLDSLYVCLTLFLCACTCCLLTLAGLRLVEDMIQVSHPIRTLPTSTFRF